MKTLLRDVLDPAVEHVQHAKQQRERIYNDNVYFTASKHPENTPTWTYKDIHYETDDEIYGEELQNEEEYVCVQGEYYGEGRDIMNIMEKKMTKNIMPVCKGKKMNIIVCKNKNTIFYHPVRISSGIRQR